MEFDYQEIEHDAINPSSINYDLFDNNIEYDDM